MLFMQNEPLLLFLIGPRGSGKSTVGRLAAKRLGLPFYDTDAMVVAEAGCSIAEIVSREGWEAFRARESRALTCAVVCAVERDGLGAAAAHAGQGAAVGLSGPAAGGNGAAAEEAEYQIGGERPGVCFSSAGRGGVISTGGGMVLARENRERMRASGLVFYLAAPVDCLYSRLERGDTSGHRPSLTGEDPLTEISRVVREREPFYAETAHYCIDASAPRGAVANAIIMLLNEARKEFL